MRAVAVLKSKNRDFEKLVPAAAVFLGLAGIAFYNYLLFHSLLELFCVLVAFGAFAIVLQTRRSSGHNGYLELLGIAYCFVGLLDLLHLLSYEGMGVFPGSTLNLAAQFWLVARLMEAVALSLAPFFLKRRLNTRFFFPAGAIFFAATAWLIFTGAFPACIDGVQGVTDFKVGGEYLVCAILLFAACGLYANRKDMEKDLLKHMLLACFTTMAAEFLFAQRFSVNGFANMTGHMLKLLSYYFIYLIIIRKKLLEPYDTINELYKSMERKVVSRTRELEAANLRLVQGKEALKKLNQKLSENNRLKSEYMAIIAHELKTPLTSIIAFSELLLDEAAGPLNDVQRSNITDMLTSAQQMQIIINDILDMMKYEAGQLKVKIEAVDLKDVFYQVRRVMSVIAAQYGVSLNMQSEGLPVVAGDSGRIRQMLINLVANAVKFTGESGQIDVFVESKGDFAAIRVRDNGEGIPKEVLPYIFDKFRQDTASSHRNRSGTGLGLAIVKKLAQLQGGTVNVESELGAGSTFTIFLPYARVKFPAGEAVTATAQADNGVEHELS